MNDNLQQRMLVQAKLALDAEPSAAEKEYNRLIDELEGFFGKNHKDVAAELQRIAKTIEDSGDSDSAFSFKQRTCEIMLRRNMEQRRQNRPAPHAVPVQPPIERLIVPPAVARMLGPLEYICMPVTAVKIAVDFYKSVLNAEQLFEHSAGSRVTAVKFAQGPALLFIEDSRITASVPLFSSDDATRVLGEFRRHSLEPALGPITTGIGSIYIFCDAAGNHFGICEKRQRR